MPIYNNETAIHGFTQESLKRIKTNFWKDDALFGQIYDYIMNEEDPEVAQEKLQEIQLFMNDMKALKTIQGIH